MHVCTNDSMPVLQLDETNLFIGEKKIPCLSVLYIVPSTDNTDSLVKIVFVNKSRTAFKSALARLPESLSLESLRARCSPPDSLAPVPMRRRLLVIINPQSGKGSSVKKWDSAVKPILVESGIFKLLPVVVTTRPNQAKEAVEELSRQDAEPFEIACFGGDGTLSEIINGLVASKNGGRPYLVHPMPSGSGNGLACSILAAAGEPLTLIAAVRAMMRGLTQGFSLFEVEAFGGRARERDEPQEIRKKIGFLSLTFGIIADTDIESERLRFLGGARFTVCGILNILRFRKYGAVVRYKTGQLGEWKSIEFQDFSSISLYRASHANSDFIAAPERRLDDQMMSLSAVRSVEGGRMGLISVMLAAETGTQSEKCKFWRPINVTDFEVTITSGHQKGAGFVLDGEPIKGEVVRGRIIPEMAFTYRP